MDLLPTTDILRARTDATAATTEPSVIVSSKILDTVYRKLSQLLPERTALNGTSNVTIAAAPSTGNHKQVREITIVNRDSATRTITIESYDGSTAYPFHSVTLAAGEKATYSEGVWKRFNAAGTEQTEQAAYLLPAGDSIVTILGSDQANSNAVANTLEDVTGLSFSVVSGGVYHFKFYVIYTAAATTTGSRWTINGPAASNLIYMSEYSLAATTTTRNANNISYQLPAGSNASSSSLTGNLAIVEGMIIPSADGTVQLQHASEVSGSAITAKAGSFVEVLRTV